MLPTAKPSSATPQEGSAAQTAIQVGVFLLLYIVAVFLLSPMAQWVGGYLVGLTIGGLVASVFANSFTLRIFDLGPWANIGLLWNAPARFHMLIGLLGGIAAAALVMGVPLLVGAAHWVRSADTGANWRTILFVPFLLFCGALGEELLFHGAAFQVMLRSFGVAATVLPVGVLFGLLHSSNPNASWLGLANTAGFGILFGLAFLRSRDLWLPIGLHFGWNLTLPLFGVNLSGITIKPTGVTLLWNTGPLWSGGDYGPEASLLTSAVLVLLLIFIWKLPIRAQDSNIFPGVPSS